VGKVLLSVVYELPETLVKCVFTCVHTCVCVCLSIRERFWGAVFESILGNRRSKTALLVQFLFLRLGNLILLDWFISGATMQLYSGNSLCLSYWAPRLLGSMSVS